MDLLEVRETALALASFLAAQRVPLGEALGRVLAEAFAAPFSMPREARSLWDGYAFASDATSGATSERPVVLRLRPGFVAAGEMPSFSLQSGECVAVLTGAPLPPGADVVVRGEVCRWEGEKEGEGGCLLIERFVTGGEGVTRSGEEAEAGEILCRRGEVVTPTRLALMAAFGVPEVAVSRRPCVALLATGHEVREPGTPLDGPWMFCNTRLLLSALVSVRGGEALSLGIVEDDSEAVAERLNNIAPAVSMVITTGGSGASPRDCVRKAWERLGITMVADGLNLAPGRGTALGVKDNRLYWILPGPPWAGQIVFEELISPVLLHMLGVVRREPPVVTAALGRVVHKEKKRFLAVNGILREVADSQRRVFDPLLPGKALRRLAVPTGSLGYILLDPAVVEVGEGAAVSVHLHDMPLAAFS